MKILKYLLPCVLTVAFSLAASAQTKNHLYSKGYKADVQLGYVFEGKVPTYSATTSHGYSFGNGLYLGAGTGLYLNTVDYGQGTRFMIPLFGEVKYSFLNRKVSPFVDLKAGMLGDCTSKGFGYMVTPTIGVDFWKMSLGVGVQKMMCNYENIALGNTGIFIGLSFNF